MYKNVNFPDRERGKDINSIEKKKKLRTWGEHGGCGKNQRLRSILLNSPTRKKETNSKCLILLLTKYEKIFKQGGMVGASTLKWNLLLFPLFQKPAFYSATLFFKLVKKKLNGRALKRRKFTPSPPRWYKKRIVKFGVFEQG